VLEYIVIVPRRTRLWSAILNKNMLLCEGLDDGISLFSEGCCTDDKVDGAPDACSECRLDGVVDGTSDTSEDGALEDRFEVIREGAEEKLVEGVSENSWEGRRDGGSFVV
jgi:hypothetical protein